MTFRRLSGLEGFVFGLAVFLAGLRAGLRTVFFLAGLVTIFLPGLGFGLVFGFGFVFGLGLGLRVGLVAGFGVGDCFSGRFAGGDARLMSGSARRASSEPLAMNVRVRWEDGAFRWVFIVGMVMVA